MYPDYLIYDEIKRRESNAWEPIPLELPLYEPHRPSPSSDEEEEESKKSDRGVVIIDMNDYTTLEL